MAAVSLPIRPLIHFDERYLLAKRVIDIVLVLLLLIPLALVMAVVAVAIVLDSRGPVFYRQKRVGENGVEFAMLKFRSMRTNCDDTLHRKAVERFMSGKALNANARNGGRFKIADDPRITRVGKFIRKTSIDELPQFLNVLAGQMSLVGPRPPLPYEVARYRQRDWLRLTGKPGVTGPWQVYGRSRVTFKQMVEMDIRYLKRQSLREDIKLIVLTVPVMLRGSGGA
ncbi:MAG: Undecaprenyl-phosphate galactosephosphotransferase [Ktedonobacterales bacterium]|jgi:lipopolysaccharide/colanic/teichoic acid biosynthesis glycosyltransferase|nr:MAG: Undecaprenyl-phosphate galactosephosphotransferase [Ktedonobacterales bacterium]